jgi:hypothetical protein
VALPQALTYMMASLKRSHHPLYGLITNGREFRFIKLNQESTYTLSRIFSLSESDNHLYEVLQILKSLGQISLR